MTRTIVERMARAARAAREGGKVAPGDVVPAVRAAVEVRNRELIGAGNDVNVTLCRATGDFFRTWGMPGARFDARQKITTEEPT